MAKDDRVIKSAVRVPASEGSDRRTFTPGMEDELAEALDSDQLQSLLDSGAIEGTWAGTTPKSDEATDEEGDEAKPKARGRKARK